MQFRVIPRTGARDDKPVKLRLPDPDPPLLVPAGVMTPPPGAVVRDLTLNEAIDQFGRLSQFLGRILRQRRARLDGRTWIPQPKRRSLTPWKCGESSI